MNTTSPRFEMLTQLANLICAVERSHPVRVAIDGVDAAGKTTTITAHELMPGCTTLADELAPIIEGIGRPVICASVDGFHDPRAVRCRRGQDSPVGHYNNDFQNPKLIVK